MEQHEILAAARRDFERARAAWADNFAAAEADLKFARLGEQWDEATRAQRERDRRPILTFNKLPAFIRQVVNDARQNKPQIKVHPQDSAGDPAVAEIVNGLIRNIETASDADAAYDSAIEQAVGQGFGFWRVNTRYSSDDAFDQDLVIERIANAFTVYGDPASSAADSSDWNVAFVVTTMSHDAFEREYPDAEKTDWDADYRDCPEGLGADGESVTLAEYWTREKVRREIVALSDGSVVDAPALARDPFLYAGRSIVGRPREVESWQVSQHVLTGAEVLKTVAWAGKYIPIVAVYGDEVVDADGRRHFRSLVRDAKSAQQMFNYWRTATTEMVALAPRAPWIGEEGTFAADRGWHTANSESHAFLEYARGKAPPLRQPFAAVPAGALQEAINASDDIKAIVGLHDASLGARSNETSGRAILARQREGDVSTFHFIDNLSRAIRHGGRILLDLIPKVYSTARVVRVLGEDGKAANVAVGPGPPRDFSGRGTNRQDGGGDVSPIYDLAVGKYDLTVKAGPSFTTMREENRATMMEAARAGGEAVAAVMLPRIARLMDLPDAEAMAEELRERLSPQARAGEDEAQRLRAENFALKARLAGKAQENRIDAYEAETRRMQALRRF
ncbi:MAG: portal protein [Sphingosinicella sp.]